MRKMKTTTLLLAALIAACTSCMPNAKDKSSKDQKETAGNTQEKKQDKRKADDNSTKYIDFTAVAPDGSEHKLSEYVKPGKYAMIDFWASWCGPCRAAIPHVRSIHTTYSDWLDVVSVSLDREESAWREALGQENMEWTQLWAAGERMESISRTYRIAGIPYLLLIDDKGEMIYAGHDPQQMAGTLEKVRNEK